MRSCILCNRSSLRLIKIIKNTKVLECSFCKLSIIEQENIMNVSANHKNLYDINNYKTELVKLNKRFQYLTNIVIKYKVSGNALDVGAGFGLFSYILSRKSRLKIDLVEPNNKIFFTSRNENIYRKTIQEFLTNSKKKYEVIIMMDIIEHFNNPVQELNIILKTLRKGGILVIQTPNYKSLMARLCINWAWWMIEDHKYVFSNKSFNILLSKARIKKLYYITYEDLYDFKKNLDGNFINIKNNLLRKTCKTIFFSLFIPLYMLSRKIIWSFNCGGLMYAVLVKE